MRRISRHCRLLAAPASSLVLRHTSTAMNDDAETNQEEEIGDHSKFVRMMARRASLLETECRRIYHVLMHKPQLLKVRYATSLMPAKTATLETPCPKGANNVLIQIFRFVVIQRFGLKPRTGDDDGSAIAVVDDAQRTQRIKSTAQMYKMPFRLRLRLSGARNVLYMFWYLLVNAWVGTQNAVICLVAFPCRAKVEGTSVVRALCSGVRHCALFFWYGLAISPLILIPSGLLNTAIAISNAFVKHKFTYDGGSGRYTRPTVAELNSLARDMEDELMVILGVGKADFDRARLSTDPSLQRMLHQTGISLMKRAQRKRPELFSKEMLDDDEESVREDLYDVLQVKRSATKEQIKAQYKKMAMLFHPDVVGAHSPTMSASEKAKAESKFEAITMAFKTLSDPDKKRAYDLGGHQGLKVQQSRMVGIKGSKDTGEVLQTIFGGRAFKERVTGLYAPTHYHCRYYLGCNVTLQEFEYLQSLRVKLLAVELARMLDVHAQPQQAAPTSFVKANPPPKCSMPGSESASSSKKNRPLDSRLPNSQASDQVPTGAPSERQLPPTTAGDAVAPLAPGSSEHAVFSPEFLSRCDAFTTLLAEACFGREMLFVIGECYIVVARRMLGLIPALRFETITYKKTMAGVMKQYRLQAAKTNPNTQQELQQRMGCEYFSIEFDAASLDAYFAVRQAAALVLGDPGVSEEVRAKRMYALWHLGEQMLRKGSPWGQRFSNDMDMQVYIVQASSSMKNTAMPPPF
jgi:hypothetical protein